MGDKELIPNGVVSDICRCGDLAPIWTSFTDENPGRKFTGCPNYQNPSRNWGCKYFAWIDPEIPEATKSIIFSLRSNVESLNSKLAKVLLDNENCKMQVMELKENNEKVKTKYLKLKAKSKSLKKIREREKWYLIIVSILVVMLAMLIFANPSVHSRGVKFLLP